MAVALSPVTALPLPMTMALLALTVLLLTDTVAPVEVAVLPTVLLMPICDASHYAIGAPKGQRIQVSGLEHLKPNPRAAAAVRRRPRATHQRSIYQAAGEPPASVARHWCNKQCVCASTSRLRCND